MNVDVDGQARIPISYLFIKEPESSADVVEFSFRVLVIKLVNSKQAVGDAAMSNLVVVEVPRPGSQVDTISGTDVELCGGAACPPSSGAPQH